MIKLNFKQLCPLAILPSCKHDSDAGRDIYSIEDIILQPGKTTVVQTGIALEMIWDFKPFDDENFNHLPIINMDFISDFVYYQEEWIKQVYKPFFQIESRSGLASKGVHATGGIIDDDYRGEIRIILANTGKASYHVQAGDRIAQGIAKLIPNTTENGWVDEFSETNRGENGFGSSGK